jgi:hypothetical protein
MKPFKKLVDVGDRALTLNFNFGMMRLAEKEFGEPIYSAFKKEPGADGADDQYRVSFDAISVIWWAALSRKHRMTREGTDTLVDEAGFEQVAEWVAEGISEYFGGGKKADAEGADPAADEDDDKPVGNARKKKA